MAELKANDSGTWRSAQQVQVNDSGTWLTIQDIKVNDGGTWRTVFQYALLSATMTEGSYVDGEDTAARGYNGSTPLSGFPTFGSMDTVAVAGGYTLAFLYDETVGGGAFLYITGFGADPGQSFFSTAVVGGVSKTSASASYSYSAGTAGWSWASTFGLDGSGTSTVVINY